MEKPNPDMLLKMRAFAESKGGKCLSEEYKNALAKHRWRCSEGHEWEAAPHDVLRGGWCNVCVRRRMGDQQRHDIEKMRQVAKARGGECLSETYKNSGTKLRWRCSEGHEWMAAPGAINAGGWCDPCSRKDRGAKLKERAAAKNHEIAKAKGGRFLSEEYTGGHIKHKWRCSEGHEWMAEPNSVKSGGSWCPVCCPQAKGEQMILEILERVSGLPFPKSKPQWLVHRRRPLELDGYNLETGIAVEYQGRQHYTYIPHWHRSESDFSRQQVRDFFKRLRCADKGVILLEIRAVKNPTDRKIREALVKAVEESCLPVYGINREYTGMMRDRVRAFERLSESYARSL